MDLDDTIAIDPDEAAIQDALGEMIRQGLAYPVQLPGGETGYMLSVVGHTQLAAWQN